MRPGSSTAVHPETGRNAWDFESAYRECTARAPDPMARPVAVDFEMRPKRSHFERAETRMLSTMASVESGTTGVPASCLGLLWFHWYDGGTRPSDSPECRVGRTSRWIQRAIKFSAWRETGRKPRCGLCGGCNRSLKLGEMVWMNDLGRFERYSKTTLVIGSIRPPTRRSDLSFLPSRETPSERAGTTKTP